MVTQLAAVAEFEIDMIRERQLEDIEIAKKKGVYKGWPPKLTKNNARVRAAFGTDSPPCFLLLHITFVTGYISCCANKERTGPKTLQMVLSAVAQSARGQSFHFCHNIRRGIGRKTIQEQMAMIWHDFYSNHLPFVFFTN
jgi:hypothetical protein